jgi:hypothetical protein
MGNIPALQEVREYFKNADKVQDHKKDKGFVELEKIKYSAGCFIQNPFQDNWIVLYHNKKGYAKILNHKESTYIITKEQLLELENGFTLPKLKEWFPDVFEVKLEVGKWYKSTYTDNTDPVNKSIIFIDSLYVNKVNGYGFDYKGIWFDKKYNCGTVGYHWSLATEQEVFEALKNEAVKRGFNSDIPIHIKSRNAYSYLAKPSNSDFFFKNNCLYLWEIKIFNKGIWAEIIPTLTKKEAEEKLNCKIV